jgi:hypothetical protein
MAQTRQPQTEHSEADSCSGFENVRPVYSLMNRKMELKQNATHW